MSNLLLAGDDWKLPVVLVVTARQLLLPRLLPLFEREDQSPDRLRLLDAELFEPFVQLAKHWGS